MLAKIRDYRKGETVPAWLVNTDKHVYLPLTPAEYYEAWMPEETDSQEFNLYLMYWRKDLRCNEY